MSKYKKLKKKYKSLKQYCKYLDYRIDAQANCLQIHNRRIEGLKAIIESVEERLIAIDEKL